MMIGDLFVRSIEPFLAVAFGTVVTLAVGVVAWLRGKRRKKRLRQYQAALDRWEPPQ